MHTSDAEYKVDRDAIEIGGADRRERAKFWEIWDKAAQRVVWVAQGCEKILDEDDPHLELQRVLSLPEAGLWNLPAWISGAGARRAAIPRSARRAQPADRPHPRAVRRARGQRLLSGRRRLRSPTRCRPRSPSRRPAACWCRLAIGRRLADPRRSSYGCRSNRSRRRSQSLVAPAKAGDRGHLSDHGYQRHYARSHGSERDPWRPTAENAEWLYAYTGQAAGAGADRARSGGNIVGDHHANISTK